jgi:hypothetical protein
MSRATDHNIIIGPIPLSALFADPMIREAFRRAERDHGAAFAIPAPSPCLLPGGTFVPAPIPEQGLESGSSDGKRKSAFSVKSLDLVRLVAATLLMATVFVAAMLPAVLR